MSVILIPTVIGDIHAISVAIVLEQMGHQPVLWHCSDMPERGSASVHLGPSQPMHFRLHGREIELPLEDVDVFWNRRVGQPVVTTELLACDREIVVRENERFVRSLLASLSCGRFAVNGFRAAGNAEDKVVQLATANRVGFDLPATLVSSDPASIRRFVAEHEDRGAIVKNFSPMGWHGEGKVAINLTAQVTSKILPRDEILRLTPAIYQGYVPKAYEVRVICMGNEQVAAKLHSQRQEQSRADWRAVAPKNLNIERIGLPGVVAQQCMAFMQDMDLRFGCFDFIVTPAGQWVFLEINQMGQFLWVEDANGEFPLLQMFCDFLVSKDPHFRYTRRHGAKAFADILSQASDRLEASALVHMQPDVPLHMYVEPGGRDKAVPTLVTA